MENKTYTFGEVLEASTKYFGGDELAGKVFTEKYALHDSKTGFYYELSPFDMHVRMAKELYRIEQKYPNPLCYDDILEYLANWVIVPQGSPMAGIGNPFQATSIGNCFVIKSPEDSYAGILRTDQEQAQLMKRRAGVGFDISTLRPRGSSTNNTSKTSDGIAVFMERFSNTTREVAQGGRRGALMLTLSIHHPDIRTFITIKQDLKKVTGANVSVRVTDEFMKAVENDSEVELRFPVEPGGKVYDKVKAKEIWTLMMESAHKTGEPGVLFWDTVQRETPADIYKHEGFSSSSTNPCVTGDTKILTEYGNIRIDELIGKNVNIWNGFEWSTVVPKVTGHSKEILKISLSSGQSLKTTLNHGFWLFDDKTRQNYKVEAKDLKLGDKLAKHSYPVIEFGELVDDKLAYSQGFISGDGMDDYDFAYVYEPKFSSIPRLLGKAGPKNKKRLAVKWKFNPRPKDFVPHGWHIKSRLSWLAGLLDSDGTELKEGGAQICSVNKGFLLEVQEMLTTMGVSSKVVSERLAAIRTFPDGRGGEKGYQCQNIYRICVGAFQIQLLKTLGLKCQRLPFDKKPNRDASRFVTVTSIEDDGTADTVYCFTETKRHMGCFNGVATAQCGEIVLSPFDSCRLLVLNALKFVQNPFLDNAKFDWVGFDKAAHIAQRLMDDIVDLELEHIDKILAKIEADPEEPFTKCYEHALWVECRRKAMLGRRTGTGLTAIGDTIAAMGMTYGNPDSIKFVEKIYKVLSIGVYEESIWMAEERGAFPVFDLAQEKNHPFLDRVLKELPDNIVKKYRKHGRRNIALTTTAPAGSVSILTQTTSGIEPAYLLKYDRWKKINPGDDAKPDRIDVVGDAWQKFTIYHPGVQKWMDATGHTDLDKSPYHNATANDINWKNSVKVQAAAQKWICHAISKTCNLPKDATVETVSECYLGAWKLGCKGFTVYRDGSRDGVLTSGETAKKKETVQYHDAPKRPDLLDCEIYRSNVAGDQWTIFLGLMDGKPYEIMGGLSKYIDLPKKIKTGLIRKNRNKGANTYDFISLMNTEDEIVVKDLSTVFENPNYGAFSRTISLALRHGVPVQYAVEQMQKGDKDSDLFSFAKVMSRVLKGKIKDGTKVTATCSECKSQDIEYREGCATCMSCGYSKCG